MRKMSAVISCKVPFRTHKYTSNLFVWFSMLNSSAVMEGGKTQANGTVNQVSGKEQGSIVY